MEWICSGRLTVHWQRLLLTTARPRSIAVRVKKNVAPLSISLFAQISPPCFDNALNRGKSHAGALEVFRAVEALEYAK